MKKWKIVQRCSKKKNIRWTTTISPFSAPLRATGHRSCFNSVSTARAMAAPSKVAVPRLEWILVVIFFGETFGKLLTVIFFGLFVAFDFLVSFWGTWTGFFGIFFENGLVLGSFFGMCVVFSDMLWCFFGMFFGWFFLFWIVVCFV